MGDKISLEEIKGFSGKYNESMFWSGLQKICSAVGKEVVYKVLQLYYVLQKDSVPTSQKVLIMGALAYLVSPIDVVPDCIPVDGRIGNGYTLGGRQFIERFEVGIFVPMHFVASGFESAWRMEPFCQEKDIPFWSITEEGETITI